ncbi:MAG: hypothetical protein QM496_12805 [Verrucomicrobiota bacterium]
MARIFGGDGDDTLMVSANANAYDLESDGGDSGSGAGDVPEIPELPLSDGSDSLDPTEDELAAV